MIKVTIASTDVRNQSGIGKASGKPYDMNFQTAYVHTMDKACNVNAFPEKVELVLDKNPVSGAVISYPVGEYLMAPSSIYVDRSGNLALRPLLVPGRVLAKAA
jgi:hypothetical protein